MTGYWSFLGRCLKTDTIYKKKLSLLLLSLWHTALLIDETKSTPWTKGAMVYLMDKLLIRIWAVPRRTHFALVVSWCFWGFCWYTFPSLSWPKLPVYYHWYCHGIHAPHYNDYYYLFLIIKLLTFEYTFLWKSTRNLPSPSTSSSSNDNNRKNYWNN